LERRRALIQQKALTQPFAVPSTNDRNWGLARRPPYHKNDPALRGHYWARPGAGLTQCWPCASARIRNISLRVKLRTAVLTRFYPSPVVGEWPPFARSGRQVLTLTGHSRLRLPRNLCHRTCRSAARTGRSPVVCRRAGANVYTSVLRISDSASGPAHPVKRRVKVTINQNYYCKLVVFLQSSPECNDQIKWRLPAEPQFPAS
jgi:hypothetical protein